MELVYGLVGAFFIISILGWYLNLPSVKGRIGERRVKKVLVKLADKYQGFQYKDIMLGIGEKSAQIDNILITKKCAYIIETKNYRGRIYGSESDQKWYQTIKYRNKRKGRNNATYYKTHIEKNDFYNPILQNRTHITRMFETCPIMQNLTVYNVVVFLNKADLKSVTVNSRGVLVIKLKKLRTTIEELEQRQTTAINQEILFTLKDQIEQSNSRSRSNLKQHIQRINTKYRG